VSAVLIHAMLEYPLEYTYFLLPLGLLIGALETASATRTRKLPGLAYGAALSVPAALVIVIGMEYMKVEESARQIRFMMVGIEQESGEPPPPPEVRLLDGLREYHRFWLQPARPGMGGDEVDRLRKVAQRYPAPPALLRLALASALNGRAEEAVRTLTVICRMHGEDRCKEGRDSWAAAGQKYPALVSIPFPVAASSIVAGPR
jgi:Virulence factor membrane-bound polymerase, C-terminal